MAIVRGLAFKVNAGPERCGSYQAAWDGSLGLDRLLPMAAVGCWTSATSRPSPPGWALASAATT